MEQDCLSHHGIKGQKWYVRRFQNKDGSLTSAGRKRYAEDSKEQKKKTDNNISSDSKKKNISEMSDEELRTAINRVKLENDYKQYVEGSKKEEVSTWKHTAYQTAKKVVFEPAVDAMAKGVRNTLDKKVADLTKDEKNKISSLLKKNIQDLNPEQLKKVVDYKDLEKRYNDHKERNSVEEKESKRIDFEQKKINLEKNQMSRDIMENQLKKSKAEADAAVERLNAMKQTEDIDRKIREGQEAVRQVFNAALALPAPEDDD